MNPELALTGLKATDLIVKRSFHDFNTKKSINTLAKYEIKSVELPRLRQVQ